MAADWLKIKSEYVSSNVSYRKLAEKYGVNKDTIALRAKKENWKELRGRQADKIHTRAIQKTEEKLSDALSDEAALKVQIRAGLFRLAADWISKQEVVGDTTDFRRMVQSCVDLGILTVKTEDEESKGGVVMIPEVGGIDV